MLFMSLFRPRFVEKLKNKITSCSPNIKYKENDVRERNIERVTNAHLMIIFDDRYFSAVKYRR